MTKPNHQTPKTPPKTPEDDTGSVQLLFGYRKVFAYIFTHLVLILLIYTGVLDVRTESIALGLLDCLKYMFMALAAGSGLEHIGRGIRSIVDKPRGG